MQHFLILLDAFVHQSHSRVCKSGEYFPENTKKTGLRYSMRLNPA